MSRAYAVLIVAISVAFLSGCASHKLTPEERAANYQRKTDNYRRANEMLFTPLIDEKATGADKMAVYAQAKTDCYNLANQRFQRENSGFMLALDVLANDDTWKRNYQDTMRRCLIGRGYAVVN